MLARLLGAVGGPLHKLGRVDDAVALYNQALEVDPLCEPLVRGLVQLLKNAGRSQEAAEVHQRHLKQVRAEGGPEPSPAS